MIPEINKYRKNTVQRLYQFENRTQSILRLMGVHGVVLRTSPFWLAVLDLRVRHSIRQFYLDTSSRVQRFYRLNDFSRLQQPHHGVSSLKNTLRGEHSEFLSQKSKAIPAFDEECFGGSSQAAAEIIEALRMGLQQLLWRAKHT